MSDWEGEESRNENQYRDHTNTKGPRKTNRDTKVEDSTFWNAMMQADLEAAINKSPVMNQAKNIIFFLGDGTSISTLTAARFLKGFLTGEHEHQVMSYEKFPYSTLIKTYSADTMVTDSAASATAYLTGVKANQDTIGVDANVLNMDCDAMNNPAYHTTSVLRNFQDAGKSTGIVTTSRVTHASPAGNYAHTAERSWENDFDLTEDGQDTDLCDDVAEQLVLGETGSKIKVIMGGGRQKFTPLGVPDPELGSWGSRLDGKDLIETWLTEKELMGNASYVWQREELLAVNTSATDYLLGLFDWSHMAYFVDNDTRNPTLEEMTRTAIEILSRDTNGYFLFVEGAKIDLAHHDNEYRSALEEALQLEKAIALADAMTDPQDTLILLTADHSHPLVINGYADLRADIRGFGGTSDIDDLPYTTLLYTNGPAYRGEVNGSRPDPSLEDYTNPHYAAATAVPRDSSTHAGEDVILYARGPQAHLFSGIHENAFIPHTLRYAACVGDGLQFCSASSKKMEGK
ncbi:hypothetical protein Pcinc_015283 [Petrolisthes cinctipes]|uniref:Alkaline phosphatase n=1 Tax=Petrolisthes cinctipes TaxID=88211 RepID=A0AAE1FTD3_PETCI|nr:hypothetical protein Pcinc_015283 [Petrolisthes cinctipes]